MDTLMIKGRAFDLNQKPVVVFPVAIWEKMQDRIKEMQEDLEMYNSINYRKSITRSRKSKKLYSSQEARKILSL
jgi:hypothetical protein